ncbi:uncharacterized protein At3g43530-like [Capsella rubella]|uniref:uncharacterized protein At3g43530-like n=1 Tax=Capsella rubella TaxID=81985 RepID=UPI000CD58A12|nr:uncharacterized protein At3g43530-like [Capsella rubella]
MALISGLYCHEYPRNMETLGSNEFVGKHFGVGTTIRYDDVQAKLLSMKRASPDRVKMAVLYFLCSVIIGKKKAGKKAPSVEPFFLRAIDDLDMCKTFPWGRLAFDENMKDIFHCMNYFGGVLSTNQWVFPNFVIPLEVLAFEAIPVLKEYCREDVSNAHARRHCPRMCKMKFKASKLKGFTLKEIYDKLGTTKDIESILTPSSREKRLLGRVMDEEKLYNQDLATRENPEDVDPEDVNPEDVNPEDVNPEAVNPEPAEKDKVEREQAEKEQAEKDKVEREQAEKEQAEREHAEKEQAERAKAAKTEKAERAKAEKAKAEKDKVDKEQADKAEKDKSKSDKEHAEKEQSEKEKSEKPETEKEKVDEEKAQLGTTDEEKEQLGTVEEEKEQLGTTEKGREEDVEMEHGEKEQAKDKGEKREREEVVHAHQGKRVKIISKKKGGTVVISSPIQTTQNAKKDN